MSRAHDEREDKEKNNGRRGRSSIVALSTSNVVCRCLLTRERKLNFTDKTILSLFVVEFSLITNQQLFVDGRDRSRRDSHKYHSAPWHSLLHSAVTMHRKMFVLVRLCKYTMLVQWSMPSHRSIRSRMAHLFLDSTSDSVVTCSVLALRSPLLIMSLPWPMKRWQQQRRRPLSLVVDNKSVEC